jgi:glycerophosphoryl diester phosphodiesterase
LDRTTTGKGRAEVQTLAEVTALTVRDGAGKPTADRVPTFSAALAWAKATDTLVQVDVKRGVPFPQVVETVRASSAAQRVIIITYTLEDALEVSRLAPEMMISASIPDESARAGLHHAGVKPQRLLNFLGTNMPAPATLDGWNAAGIETIVGTLGTAGRRLDDRFMADGDGSEYAVLAAAGVAMIATDRPRDAWAALKRAGRSGEQCLGERQ